MSKKSESDIPLEDLTEAEISRLRQQVFNEIQPKLKRLPPKEREILSEMLEITLQHSGSIPLPIVAARYEELLPGATDRLFKMAEMQTANVNRRADADIEARNPNLLLAGLIGGGVSVLISKVFDLLAAGYSGHGYQFEFPENVFTALFIFILMGILLVSRPRRREVRRLAEENDRRLAEIDARLGELRHSVKR